MSSESPAQWPGALFDPLLSLFFPINSPFLLISRERAFVPVPPTFSPTPATRFSAGHHRVTDATASAG